MKMMLKSLLGNVLLCVALVPPGQAQVSVEWIEQNGVFIETGTPSIAQSAATEAWGVSGAISMNRLATADDGSFHFTTDRDGLEKAIGLSDANVDDDYRSIDYGIRFSSSGATVVENGADRYQYGQFNATDVFSIEKVSGNIQYAVNGEVFYQSGTAPTAILMVDVAFKHYNTEFDNIDASFGGTPIEVRTVASSGLTGSVNEGSTTLAFSTGTPFTWMPLTTPEVGQVATQRIDFLNEGGGSQGYLTIETDHAGNIRNPKINLFDGTDLLTDDLADNAFNIGLVGGGDKFFIDFLISWEDLVNGYWKYNTVCAEDRDIHWTEQRVFNETGQMVRLSKDYRDDLGRVLQTQYVEFDADEVLAIQQIHDDYGRTVLKSLPATVNQQALCYKEYFVTNASGDRYTHTDFDVPNYTASSSVISAGEVDQPKPVHDQVNGTLGWYYSRNNSLERQVGETDFPYNRVEHDINNLGNVKRTSMAGDPLRMGNGHEAHHFTLPAAGELYYVYGYGKGWNVYYDNYATSGEVSVSSFQATEYNVRKYIRIDQNGKEYITFKTRDGRVIATCSSGQVNGQNESTFHVSSEIHKNLGYTDIHLPEGCENSVALTPNNSYQVLDLQTDRYVSFGGGTVFIATAGNNTPTLYPGIFRVIDINAGNYVPGTAPTLTVEHELNYYDFTLNYYDKAKRLVKSVTPEGYDRDLSFDPQLTDSYNSNPLYSGVGASGWSLDGSSFLDEFSISVPQASNGYSEFTILSAFITQTATPIPNVNHINQGLRALDPEFPEVLTASVGSHLRYSPNNELTFDVGVLQDPENPISGSGGSGVPPLGWQLKYVFNFDILSNHQVGGQQVKVGDNLLITAYYMGSNTWQYDYHHTDPFAPNIHKALVDLALSEHNHTNTIKVHSVKEYIPTPGGDFQTYNYTELHQLRFRFDAVTYNLDGNNPDERLFSTNDYNSLGWMLGNTTPDEGATEYLYRKDGQVRFSQNAQQALEGRFTYFNYDALGRISEQGVFTTPGETSQDKVSFVNAYYLGAVSNPPDKTVQFLEHLYDPQDDLADGLSSAHCQEQVFTQYDLRDQGGIDAVAGVNGQGGSIYVQRFVRGRVSKTWTQNPTTNTTWYSYDERGRVEWTLQDIDGLGLKTVHYEYNTLGEVSRIIFQKNNSGELFIQRYSYDKNGRLVQVETSTDDITYLTHADYAYYLHGPLKRTELGGVEQTQGIDYTYTVNSWLKAINHSGTRTQGLPDIPGHTESTNYDPGDDGLAGSPNAAFAEDIFGMVIDYFDGDYTRDQSHIGASLVTSDERFTGDVRAVRWKNLAPGVSGLYGFLEEMAYGYTYDHQNRLTDARFGQHFTDNVTVDANGYAISNGTFTPSEDYQVSDGTYDANGNLTGLKRNGYQGSGLTRDMDDFTYRYAVDVTNRRTDNQLQYLDDFLTGNQGNNYNDIQDQAPGNYKYDERGQLVYDDSKEEYYTYNDRGQLTGVYGTPSHQDTKAEFDYDERGQRVRKRVYDGSGNLTDTYWYVNGADGNVAGIYHAVAGAAAQPLEHPIHGNDRVGLYYPDFDQYNYEINDQLGNVRAVVERAKSGITAVVAKLSDFYPFGHPLPGRQYANTLNYRHGFQGEHTEWDAVLGLTAFEARHWDGRLGRWTNPDPARQFASPYVGMGNSPIIAMDPDGRIAFAAIVMIAKPLLVAGAFNLLEQRAEVLDDDGFGTNLLQAAGFVAVGAAAKAINSEIIGAGVRNAGNALVSGDDIDKAFKKGMAGLVAEMVSVSVGRQLELDDDAGKWKEVWQKSGKKFATAFSKNLTKDLMLALMNEGFDDGENFGSVLQGAAISASISAGTTALTKTQVGKSVQKFALKNLALPVSVPVSMYTLFYIMAENPSDDDILNFARTILFANEDE